MLSLPRLKEHCRRGAGRKKALNGTKASECHLLGNTITAVLCTQQLLMHGLALYKKGVVDSQTCVEEGLKWPFLLNYLLLIDLGKREPFPSIMYPTGDSTKL